MTGTRNRAMCGQPGQICAHSPPPPVLRTAVTAGTTVAAARPRPGPFTRLRPRKCWVGSVLLLSRFTEEKTEVQSSEAVLLRPEPGPAEPRRPLHPSVLCSEGRTSRQHIRKKRVYGWHFRIRVSGGFCRLLRALQAPQSLPHPGDPKAQPTSGGPSSLPRLSPAAHGATGFKS